MSDSPILIDQEICKGCGKCASACPFGVIHMEGKLVVLNADECRGCNACVDTCPFDAMTSVTTDDIKDESLKEFEGVWVFAEQHHGKVEEYGTHQELLALKGLYHTLHELQFQEVREDPT